MAYGEEYTEEDASIVPDDLGFLGSLEEDPEIQALIGRAAGELELNLVDGPLLPDEKENVPTNFAGYAALAQDKKSGLGLKESYLTGVEGAKEGDVAAGAKADLIESGAAEEPQTRSQAIAQALIGITPILIGMAIKGKKGAAIGAQAGGLGVGMIEKQRLEDEKRLKDERQELRKLGVQQVGQNQRALLSQAMQNARADQNFERQKKLIEFREGLKVPGAAEQPIDEETLTALSPALEGLGLTKEQMRGKTKGDIANFIKAGDFSLDVTDTGRRYDQNFQLRPQVRTELAALRTVNAVIDDFKTRLAEVEKTQGPGILGTPIDKILRQFPQSKLGQLADDLNLLAVTARGAKESGVMTEPDYLRWKEYVSIRETDTVESLTRRLDQLKKEAMFKAKSFLEGEKSAGMITEPMERMLGLDLSYIKPMTTTARPLGLKENLGGESKRERYERLKAKYGKQ